MHLRENRLFNKWKKQNTNFVTDGVVNEKSYTDSRIKIVFILKEVNGGQNWDLRDFLNKGARARTWNNIALWQFGIQNISSNYNWLELKKN